MKMVNILIYNLLVRI